MQRIVDLAKKYSGDHNIDNTSIIYVEAAVNSKMNLDGWISLFVNDGNCLFLKYENGAYKNEKYLMNEKMELKSFENDKNKDLIHNEESVEEGIVDLDHGTRFEGSVLKENGIPFGFGTMYDNEGLLVHKGVVIDWKRFGYGVSYRDNASVEYEGYWCDDKRCGRGKLYDRSGQLIKECKWWNGSDCGTEYIGDGSQPVYIGIKHLKLGDRSVLSDWNVSWFYNLESIEIGDNCFNDVAIFEIKEMPQLRSLKIGSYSFGGNQKNHSNGKIKSFCIMDCESLELLKLVITVFIRLKDDSSSKI